MEILWLIVSAVCTFLYCYLTALKARQMDACQEPEFVDEIDQYRSDVFIHFWSAIYASNPALHRVSFDCFLLNPRGYLSAHVWRVHELAEAPEPEPLPLLPRQMYVADQLDHEQVQQEKALARLEQQYTQISNRNGQFFVPMHTRRPRKWQTRGTHLKPV